MIIAPILEADRPFLWRQLQDYIRELSAFDPSVHAVDGVYHYPYLDSYWQDEDRWPFWVKAGDDIAGFALLRRTEEGPMEVAEFYVLPAHRRSGIGLAFARDLIARYPGQWTISEYKASTGAIAFWRRVIEGRAYVEHDYVSENGNARLEQRFTV